METKNKREIVESFRTHVIMDLLRNHKGRMVTLVNRKRSNGEVRVFNGKLGIATLAYGLGKYDCASKGLLPIQVVTASIRDEKGRFKGNTWEWRNVAVETIVRATYNGKEHIILDQHPG